MGLQSAVIGYRFGFGYEQGKRAVRKMSNEEFNNLDEEAEQAMFKRHDSGAINYFKTEMVNWVELQNLIIEKSVEIEVMKANRTPSAFREMFEGFTKGFTTQQTEDAKSFFDSLADPIMKLIAWFAGHRGSQQTTTQPPTQTPFPPDRPEIPQPRPLTPPPKRPDPRKPTVQVRKLVSFMMLKFTSKGAKWFITPQRLKLNLKEMKSFHKNQIKMVALAVSRRWLSPFELQQSPINLNKMNTIIRNWK